MRTFQQQLNYERLELLPPQGIRGLAIAFPSTLRQLWTAVLTLSDQKSAPEPQIHEVLTPSGKVIWRVYDFADDCSVEFDSEQEVLVWLEERHYSRR
jgi:hypothetical protein